MILLGTILTIGIILYCFGNRSLKRKERELMDLIVQWAYYKGWEDGRLQHNMDDGADLTVHEFRERFSETARIVRK